MWKNRKRCAVVLTWAFDAEAMWFGALDRNSPGYMERGAYGARTAFDRVMRLLEKFRVPCTFFVPAWVAINHRPQIEELMKGGFEIAYEGYFCEVALGMSMEDERTLIQKSLEALEPIIGERPRGARVVGLDHNPHTAKLLLEAGFLYDSSLMGDDNPYAMQVEGSPRPLIQLPVNWDLNDFTFFTFYPGGVTTFIADNEAVLTLWKAEFDQAYIEGGLFLLSLHPQITGRRSRIVVLERLLEYITGQNDVWFATGAQAAEAWINPRRVPWPPPTIHL